MLQKLSSRMTRKRKLLLLGAFLVLVGVVLAASFQFMESHKWYWTAAPLVCLLILTSAGLGGWLIGHCLSRGQIRRMWLAALGSILGIGWLGMGALAAVLAALGMYYLPAGESYIGWDSHSAGYLLRGFNISLLQLATATGVLGGFAFGLGLAVKRFRPGTWLPALVARVRVD
jgi:hypothetical protein